MRPLHLPIVHHPAYDAKFDPLHRFPMGKFGLVAKILREDGLAPEGFHVPGVASAYWVGRVHDPAYVTQVFAADVPRAVEKRIGFDVDERVARRSRHATAGTWLAAKLALAHGLACNTAGGSHHAGPEGGAGFCVFNDVAVAASALLETSEVERISVLDCDVHQGDGTARIFANEPRVQTVSIHAERNYPDEKAASDLDVPLADAVRDDEYLDVLARTLPAVDAFKPQIVFYNAGVDPHRDDRLGRLALTDEGLVRRDTRVFGHFRDQRISIVGVLGGGYSRDLRTLARRHTILHRVAARRYMEEGAAPPSPLESEEGREALR